jgi:uncharacterized spore protein YtfJ
MAVRDWSTIAGDNDDSDADEGINLAEGQAPGSLNDSARAIMAEVKEWFDTGYLTAKSIVITADQTYTPTTGVRALRVRAVGGGGGGGGCNTVGTNEAAAGSGGGAGAFIRDLNGTVIAVDESNIPYVPTVSSAQAKIALFRAGLLDTVQSAVTGEAAIWFADALTWRRDNPNVVGIGAALGLSDAQIDELFAVAASIDA